MQKFQDVGFHVTVNFIKFFFPEFRKEVLILVRIFDQVFHVCRTAKVVYQQNCKHFHDEQLTHHQNHNEINDGWPTFEIPKVQNKQMPFFVNEYQIGRHYAIPK